MSGLSQSSRIGGLPKEVLVMIGVIPIMAVTTIASLDEVPDDLRLCARTLGASPCHAMLRVQRRGCRCSLLLVEVGHEAERALEHLRRDKAGGQALVDLQADQQRLADGPGLHRRSPRGQLVGIGVG